MQWNFFKLGFLLTLSAISLLYQNKNIHDTCLNIYTKAKKTPKTIQICRLLETLCINEIVMITE